MDNSRIRITAVEPKQFETYIQVGRKSYCQHYLHLWEDQDPTPYFKNSFHELALKKEWEDPNCLLFLIHVKNNPAGIVKILLNKTTPAVKATDCLFLERIYILNEYSGQGLGTYALAFIEKLARKYRKNYVWLESMQKGKALDFYKQKGFTVLGEKLLNYPNLVESERPMYIMGRKLN